MEATLDFDVSGNSLTEELVAERTTEELDDILEEVIDLAGTMETERPTVDNMVEDGEETSDQDDFAMQTGDDLELEIELPMEATESQAEIASSVEVLEPTLNALIDEEDEIMAVLAKEAGVNDSEDLPQPAKSKDAVVQDTDKTLAEDMAAHAREGSTRNSYDNQLAHVLRKKVEATVTNLLDEQLTAVIERTVEEKLKKIFANIR